MIRLSKSLLFAALLTPLFFGQPAHAQANATRDPLNIVPKKQVKPANFSRRDTDSEKPSAILPALKPGGAALNRRLRSVAALPGGRGSVRVGSLGDLEETDIGLARGLGADLWQASRMSTMGRLLPRLPTNFALTPATELAVDLLISRAAPPPGLRDGKSFFALRLERLLALGQADNVAQLVEMTGADQRDAGIAKTLAQAHLALGNVTAACGTLGALERLQAGSAEADFAIILRSFCQIKSGAILAANLTLDLARDAGVKDALALDALFALTAKIPLQRSPAHPQTAKGQKLSIMQTVLLHEAQAPLLVGDVAAVPIAMLPIAAKSQYQTQEVQLLLAERAVLKNKLSPAYLRALMHMVEFGVAPVLDADDEVLSVPDVIFRARQIRILDEPVTAKGQMRALTDIFSNALKRAGAAENQAYWALAVTLAKPALTSLKPDIELVSFTPYAVPALLWLGETARAQAWVDVMLETQNQLPSAVSRNLQSLIRLVVQADNPTDSEDTRTAKRGATLNDASLNADTVAAHVPPMEAILMGAVLETGSQAQQNYIHSELAILPLFGYELPDFLRNEKPARIKDKVLARSLADMDASLARGQKGDALVYALIALAQQEKQQEQKSHYDMAAIGRILTAVQQLGLTAQSRALAKHILVIQAARLTQG